MGGAEISTQILAESLSDITKVNIITVGGHRKKEGIIEEEINKVSVLRLPSNNLYWIGERKKRHIINKILWHIINGYNVFQYKEVKRVLLKVQPSIIHTQNLPGLSLGVWKAAHELGIPIVHTLRDYSLLCPVHSSIYSTMYRKIVRNNSKNVSSVIGISNFILNKHLDEGLFQFSKKYVVPNVVEDAVISKEKNFTKNPLILGYFGQLESNKGVQFLIQAVKKIPCEIVSRLFIVGNGQLKEELLDQSDNDPRIIFLGKLEQKKVRDIMGQVDLTIVPSIWEEPFGRVIIESYQVGTPVYASNVGGIPEVIISSKFLFEPQNSNAILKAVKSYFDMSSEEKSIIQKNCIEHCANFNSKISLKKHLEIYNLLKS
jgi:glycosyltransferase involved in cell wall biosynthesis